MPSKKPAKPKRRSSVTRERSKSAGRASSRTRGHTSTKIHSRSKTPKRSRTPASESKIKRRRSPSSSRSSSPSSKDARYSTLKDTASATDSSDDKHSKPMVMTQIITPSRFSQRIIQKLESTKSTAPVFLKPISHEKTSSSIRSKTSAFIRSKICSSPLTAFLGMGTLLPFIFWLNLLVLTPASSHQLDLQQKVSHTIWGPAYRITGVLWPIDWRVYLDYKCFLFVLSYLFFHLLIARFVPIGYRLSNPNTRRPDLRYNGLFALFFCCAIYATAQFGGFSPATKPTVLLNKCWFSLLSSTGLIASLFAVIAHFASAYTPRSQRSADGNSGNVFVDLWSGRSVNPRWLGFDWKWILMRPGPIALLLFHITRFLAQWEQFDRVSPVLCSLVAMYSIWVLDYYVFEHTMLFGFDILYAGFGYYLILTVLMYPFVDSIGSSYLSSRPDVGRIYSQHEPDKLNCFLLVVSIVIFLLGYVIYRKSCNQKALFRRQPNHPSFAELDKISGPHSHRLLAGGWWGFVRHPNYLGALMMNYAFYIPSGWACPLLWLHPILVTCFLCHRIWRMEYLNSEKYGVSYTMYKKLVPYRLLPRIF